MLTAPAPTLAYEVMAPGIAAREYPVSVRFGPVLDGDAVLRPQDLRTASLLAYRQGGPSGGVEAWDSATRSWVPEGLAGPSGDRMVHHDGDLQPWEGLVVGASDQFSPPEWSYLAFTFRGMFATDDEVFVTGESEPVVLRPVSERNLVVIGPPEDEKPENATEALVRLKDTPFSVVGELHIYRSYGSATVSLVNSAGASVLLHPDGSIDLTPAPGKAVRIAGDVETGRLSYLDAGGTRKQAN